MSDTLAPDVSAEELAAMAELDAAIDGGRIEEPAATPEPEAKEPAPATEPEPERDYEAEAKADGWTTLEEWVAAGKDPEKHRDAKTFVELADNDPAVLRRKITEERKRNEDFQRRVTAATRAQVERVRQESEKQHRDQIRALEAERDALIDQYAGNPDAIRQINQKFETERQNIPQPVAPEIAEWFAGHPEFDTDPVFNAAVVAMGDKLKGKPYAEQVKELDAEMARRFPEYYGTAEPKSDPKPANGAPPANSRSIDGARTIQTRDVKSFDTLPAEAKAMFKTLEADGIKIKKEDFAKDFYNG